MKLRRAKSHTFLVLFLIRQTENYRRLEEGYGLQRFTCPVIQLQRAYAAAGQDVYAYEFTHRSDKHLWPEYMGV